MAIFIPTTPEEIAIRNGLLAELLGITRPELITDWSMTQTYPSGAFLKVELRRPLNMDEVNALVNARANG